MNNNYINKLSDKSFEELSQILHELDKDKYPDKYEDVSRRINEILKKSENTPTLITFDNEIKYGGFFRRFSAVLIDAIVILVLSFMVRLALFNSPIRVTIISNHVVSVFIVLLEFVLLVYFGGSIGKLLLGLKVIRSDGQNIKITNALLRSSVELFSTFINLAIFLIVFNKINFEHVKLINGAELHSYWKSIYPNWNYVLQMIISSYIFSESFIMLTNKKKRALHDFIGGTVVICRPKTLKEIRYGLYNSISMTNQIRNEIDNN